MSMLNSTEYYVAREQRERELADAANDPAIASIHRDMADRYAQLLWPLHNTAERKEKLHV